MVLVLGSFRLDFVILAEGRDKAPSDPMAQVGLNIENNGIDFGFFQAGFCYSGWGSY